MGHTENINWTWQISALIYLINAETSPHPFWVLVSCLFLRQGLTHAGFSLPHTRVVGMNHHDQNFISLNFISKPFILNKIPRGLWSGALHAWYLSCDPEHQSCYFVIPTGIREERVQMFSSHYGGQCEGVFTHVLYKCVTIQKWHKFKSTLPVQRWGLSAYASQAKRKNRYPVPLSRESKDVPSLLAISASTWFTEAEEDSQGRS